MDLQWSFRYNVLQIFGLHHFASVTIVVGKSSLTYTNILDTCLLQAHSTFNYELLVLYDSVVCYLKNFVYFQIHLNVDHFFVPSQLRSTNRTK